MARWGLNCCFSNGCSLCRSTLSIFPHQDTSGYRKISLLTMNTTDIRTWWQHDVQDAFMRDESLPPTTIPSFLFILGLILTVVGIPILPWFIVGSCMLLLSVGLNNRVPVHFGQWFAIRKIHRSVDHRTQPILI